jgi:hypothetical protein
VPIHYPRTGASTVIAEGTGVEPVFPSCLRTLCPLTYTSLPLSGRERESNPRLTCSWSYTESNRVVNACKARPLPQLLSPKSEIRSYRSPVLSYSCERKVFTPYLA